MINDIDNAAIDALNCKDYAQSHCIAINVEGFAQQWPPEFVDFVMTKDLFRHKSEKVT